MQILTILVPLSTTTSNFALSCKSLLDWLSNNGFPIKTDKRYICLQNIDYYQSLSLPKSDISKYAARNGDIQLLEWAKKNGGEWNTRVCAYAAEKGQLECLKWLKVNNCPRDEWTFVNAAEEGHPECVGWALETGCPIPMNYPEYLVKHPKVKEWLEQKFYYPYRV